MSNVIDGTKLYYSYGEILRMYNESKDKEEQVKILAQLNDCSEDDIRAVLKWAGTLCDNITEHTNENNKNAIKEYRGITWKSNNELSLKLGKSVNFVSSRISKGQTHKEIIDECLTKPKENEYKGIKWKTDKELSIKLNKSKGYVYMYRSKGWSYERIIDWVLDGHNIEGVTTSDNEYHDEIINDECIENVSSEELSDSDDDMSAISVINGFLEKTIELYAGDEENIKMQIDKCLSKIDELKNELQKYEKLCSIYRILLNN